MTVVTIRDPSLVLLVGAAGSGKSTLARRLFEPSEIVSSDALRAAVAGDEADQTATRTAFALLHREVERRLAAGRLTAVDATNVRADHRRALSTRARRAGIATAAVVLDLPPALVHARNAGRARTVPPDVVDRQLGWLRATLAERQLLAEGFDAVVVLRDVEEIDGLRLVRSAGDPPLTPLG
jgi:predicted kinase